MEAILSNFGKEIMIRYFQAVYQCRIEWKTLIYYINNFIFICIFMILYKTNSSSLFFLQVLPKLKRLDLSYSRKLTRVPDLSLCPNIEQIILSGCVSLVDIYSSSFLNKLNFLCLHDCVELRSLNLRRDGLSRSSGLVVLYGCVRLELVVLVESLYFLF